MRTSKQDLRNWFRLGKRLGAHHMVWVDNYPVFVLPETHTIEAIANLVARGKIERMYALFNLDMDCEQQVQSEHTWNL